MNKLKMHTPDFTQEKIAQIRELFPTCVTEAKDEDTGELRLAIDFDQLRQELSDQIVEGPQERYRLDWPGKREAILAANAPIAKTLRPARDESVEFDTTQNLFIEGDNLDALKLLQETYLGKVKMIYIDPPYNTGNDFIYNDNFAETTQEYLERSNQVDEEGRLLKNKDSSGRFHSDWLSMMYPRLRLARNLLSDEGACLVHIDEHEFSNLEKVLSEVFGPNNVLGVIIWDKRHPKGDSKRIASQHEYVVAYAKNICEFLSKNKLERPKENAVEILEKAATIIKRNGRVDESARIEFRSWIAQQPFSGGEKAYQYIDDAGEVYQPVSMAWPNKNPAPKEYFIPLIHPTTGQECPVPSRGWRYPPRTMHKLLEHGLIIFGEDETIQPRRKYLLKDYMMENVSSVLSYGGSDDSWFARAQLGFDNPKPLAIAQSLIQPLVNDEDLILDFFAGSSTTAHAVMKLNAEDGGNRKFIMVQLPEEVDKDKEAYRAGYKNIADLSKERIRRAGKQILEGECHEDWDRDIGFRVLKIDSSNMKDVYYRPGELSQEELFKAVDNIKEDRTNEDLLFQVLVDWGVDLRLPIRREQIQGKEVFIVDDNALIACFDKGITEDLIKELAALKPLRVVFRDSGFSTDAVKINAMQIFKQVSPDTDMKTL